GRAGGCRWGKGRPRGWPSPWMGGGGGGPARNSPGHDVHRPRPPQVAVMSMEAACAALRIVVPGATVTVRRAAGSPGSATKVSGTAMASHSSGMLARMEISLESLKRTAALAGFAWTDAELEAIRPAVQRLLESLGELERLDLGAAEPTTQYRVL